MARDPGGSRYYFFANLRPRKKYSHQSVASESGDPRRPQPAADRAAHEKAEEHGKGHRAQRIEVQSRRPLAFPQRKQSSGQPAEWAQAAGKPMEAAPWQQVLR